MAGSLTCEVCGSNFDRNPKDGQRPRRACSRRCALVIASSYRYQFTAEEYLWSKVVKGAGCWEWQGATVTGYGTARYHNRRVLAHRLSWEIHRGPIPAGMDVCHHCDNPPCVRPDHLFVGTRQDNMDDMVRKGRKRPTHCKYGHPFTEENTHYRPEGGRSCRTCIRRRNRQKVAA